jgi:hypothetical protein
VTPLGLSPAELAQALVRYRLRLDALIQALGSSAPMTVHHDAFSALEDLSAMIEVDIGARSASSGQARMSEVERLVLVPLLVQLEELLAGLRSSVPSRDWLPGLRAADDDVAHAERALAHHAPAITARRARPPSGRPGAPYSDRRTRTGRAPIRSA